MKAVMYGGGNIGRGFVGALLSQSGYEVTFIDVAEPVVKALQKKGTYPVRYVSSDGCEDVWIENVTAVNGNDAAAASQAIADCDIMATAVGARILKFIVPNIVAGLRKRWAEGKAPLNIIICENLMDANKVLEGMLKEHLSQQEQILFDETVGLVEASIGRMVPVQTDAMKAGEPMRVCVERYGFLPVDKGAFKGEIPQISSMVPFEPFDFYIKRKLYIHNMGHAVCAYLGDLLGLEYIYQAIDEPDIRLVVQNAMLESAVALSEKYHIALQDILRHIDDLLHRFTNAALQDTCQRVGGDPSRKLSAQDRLIGSSKLLMEAGQMPAYISVGAAAGLKRLLDENSIPQSLQNAKQMLMQTAKLEENDPLIDIVLKQYDLIIHGADIAVLRRSAEKMKAQALNSIV